jgi:hypothetical protein
MAAVDIFRIFGGVVDDFLAIPDILSRLGTRKDVYTEPSSAAAVLRSLKQACDDRKEHDADFMPTVRHLIRSIRRPLTTARADEIIDMAAHPPRNRAYVESGLLVIEASTYVHMFISSLSTGDCTVN